jgi:glycosyltransferase involved in cell wall biosynthesis
MRALILTSGAAPGGAETAVAQLLRRLAADGVDVAACTLGSPRDRTRGHDLEFAAVRRFDLGARRLADPLALRRLHRLLRVEGIDLIHAHGQAASILAAAARPATRVRLAITRHVLDEPEDSWSEWARARAVLHAFRRADAAVAVSGAAADRLAELARIPRPSVRVIRNGIDVDGIATRPGGPARAELARSLGIDATDRVILLPAELRACSGHGVLLSTLPMLRVLVPRVRLLFAGSGEEAGPLRAQAAPHGRTVLFLEGRIAAADLLAACDVVALPSFSEALPTTLMEAAAAGRPVVATNVGGTAEVVVHGRTGLLVPPGDGTALAGAIAELLLDPGRARGMGEDAVRLARERFTIEQHARDTTALWAELVGGYAALKHGRQPATAAESAAPAPPG